jgi:tRNA threonylcarbamoyl adenosine modification protein (Sua5/YciO/YrdC/YwlC family)
MSRIEVEEAVQALAAGRLVVLPTDTVYGLCASALDARAVARINKLKGRVAQPIALVAASAETLTACVPELAGRWQALLEAFLPGPFTLVLPNPARRLSWLSPGCEETIGVRIPELQQVAGEVLRRFGAVAVTSANRHRSPDARSLEEVSGKIRKTAAVLLDGGRLPGVPSTVIDLSGPEPRVLRAGAGDPLRALELARAALGR